jgi:hypothetical protein
VRSKKAGRVRTYELRPKKLQAVESWFGKQRAHWETRLDQLDEYLEEMEQES